MKRVSLRTKLLLGMFVILSVSIGLVASQAVMLFQEDKSAYVFDLNASRAIRIADEIQSNVRHLAEKMRIFSNTIGLEAPQGVDQRWVLQSMLRQYPEFLLFTRSRPDGSLEGLFQSPLLSDAGLSIEALHRAYRESLPMQTLSDQPLIVRLTQSSNLRTFTLALRGDSPVEGEPGPILIAECALDRLYAGAGESRLHEIYITDNEGKTFLSATGAGGETSPSFADLLPETSGTAGTREYDASGVPMLAAYAPVGDLGVWTVVQIPKARAFEAARQVILRSLVIAGAVLFVAITLILFFASSITKPLVALSRATEQIGLGRFDVKIPVSGRDEIGALGERFNRMGEELMTRANALEEANQRLVQSEKMSALGQLGAGIAHEVKNPLASIRGFAQLGIRKTDPDDPMAEYFRTIEKETGRSLKILNNLLKFSRQETAEMSRVDINDVVTDTIKLVDHQLGMKKVQLNSTLFDGPLHVVGNANQIEQVLLNLFMNAGDAMEADGGGTLTVTTDRVDGAIRIKSTDTGCGIPADVKRKIFDPFFTTKPVGKGTGLGLSVSYGIIKEHKGEITVDSEIGKGTTFTITIPLAPPSTEDPITDRPKEEKRVRVISLR